MSECYELPACRLGCDQDLLIKTQDVTAVCFHCRGAYVLGRLKRALRRSR